MKGIINVKQNNEPLAYVSIGLKEKPIGTISDSDGPYSLEVHIENVTDTLLLSLIGYESKLILISQLKYPCKYL
ncbi:MAG: carboxypeptidase-like regulatory domain-containing protein [Chitinophagaceae bacterium]